MLGNLQRRGQACAALRDWPVGRGCRAHWPSRRFLGTSPKSFEEVSLKLPHRSSKSAGNVVAESPMNLDSVAQVVKYNGVWGAIKSFPKRKPFMFNLILSGTMMPIADYNIQRTEGTSWDCKRSIFFCIFGFYNGLAWWCVYVSFFSRIFPKAIRFSNMTWAEKLTDRAGQKQLVGQCAVDLLMFVPLVYFPVFYAFKAGIKGEPLITAWHKWKQNFLEDNGISLGFWVPGDVLCFAVPAWLRLPTSHAVSFSWNSILSWLRGNMGSDEAMAAE